MWEVQNPNTLRLSLFTSAGKDGEVLIKWANPLKLRQEKLVTELKAHTNNVFVQTRYISSLMKYYLLFSKLFIRSNMFVYLNWLKYTPLTLWTSFKDVILLIFKSKS